MTTIELNDPFTGEWTSFLETDFTYNGSSITDTLCDNVLYKKVNGKYYRRILIKNIINAKWFGVTGDSTTDDTVKMNEAISKSAVANGILFFPEGKYKITGYGLDLLSNSNLTGVGKDTVFEMQSDADWCITANKFSGGTEYVKDNIKNIKIFGIHFKSANGTFCEKRHLMSLNAVSNVVIENCLFTQFRGDGIYIGSSTDGGLIERHNERVFIRNCHFDGVNHGNRNAITFIDCNTAVIEDCTFINCTQFDMPGAIDIEPDAYTFHIIKNINIRNNTFKNIGGNVGVISIIINKITPQCQNIIIENNYISECNNAHSIAIATSRGAESFDQLNDCMVTVRNNISEGKLGQGTAAFTIGSSKNIKFFDNKFKNYDKASLIGYVNNPDIQDDDPTSYASNLFMERNLFEKLGITQQSGFYCYNVKNFKFKNNELKEISKRENGNDFFFYFIRGNSSEIIFDNNQFISVEGASPGYTIVMGTGHITEENTNKFTDNYCDGLYNWNFHWLRDSAPLSFRNATPPNGHVFYDETNNVSQIYLGGLWKTIKMEP